MKPSESYFYRNRGSWDWKIAFKVQSYRKLWQTDFPLITKLRLTAFVLCQGIVGPFSMWTQVDFQQGQNTVYHTTKIEKWGISLYRSEKKIELNADGRTLLLRGVEYFWPLLSRTVSFAPLTGSVDVSTTHAFYQMPLAGATCDCRTYLDKPEGYIEIQTAWLTGRFTLTHASGAKLALRLSEES